MVSGQVALVEHRRPRATRVTTLPSRSVKPCGLFIHALAHTTKNADSTPATNDRDPGQQMGARRKAVPAVQIDAEEDASMKKAKPSIANGSPITEP